MGFLNWNDHVNEFDQALRQSPVTDVATANARVVFLAEQSVRLRSSIEAGFHEQETIVGKLKEFETKIDRILNDMCCLAHVIIVFCVCVYMHAPFVVIVFHRCVHQDRTHCWLSSIASAK